LRSLRDVTRNLNEFFVVSAGNYGIYFPQNSVVDM